MLFENRWCVRLPAIRVTKPLVEAVLRRVARLKLRSEIENARRKAGISYCGSAELLGSGCSRRRRRSAFAVAFARATSRLHFLRRDLAVFVGVDLVEVG